MYAVQLTKTEDVIHYGIKRKSGRYPYGSGERPFQSEVTKKEYANALEGKDRSGLIRERTIKKGTTMYRTTSKDTDSSGPIYVTYLEPDRAYYRSNYAFDIAERDNVSLENGGVKENTYTLKQDLKIPSRDDTYRAKAEVLKNRDDYTAIIDEIIRLRLKNVKNKSISEFTPQEIQQYIRNVQAISSQLQSDNIKDVKTAFNLLTISKRFQNKLAENLSKKGYNAIVDEWGVGGIYSMNEGGRREGIDPLIIFDSSILNKTGSETITKENFDKYADEYYENELKRNKYDKAGIGKWGVLDGIKL